MKMEHKTFQTREMKPQTKNKEHATAVTSDLRQYF